MDTALHSYERAANVAAIELTPTHPIRLGLALNFSVFYYDIARKKEQACVLAKQAFDDSMAELDTMEEATSGDSMVIMHLLRKSLTEWSKQVKV